MLRNTGTLHLHITVAHRFSNAANVEELNWGDTYEEYEDFEYTSQTWH